MKKEIVINDMEFEGLDCIETFCERRGFVFHTNGRGKWGAYPFYTFEKKNDSGTTRCSIEYTPFSNEIKIDSLCGSFKGHLKTVTDLAFLLEAMGIEVKTVQDKAQSQKTAQQKMERKMAIANRIATQIKMKYGFSDIKCLEMAMQGDWWQTTNHLSQMSNRDIPAYTSQVLDAIQNDTII